MKREEYLQFCLEKLDTSPDYPFEKDAQIAVLRHTGNKKWFGVVMKVSRRKLGQNSDEITDIVNLKLPTEMFGSFSSGEGVYPAYHMNKLHWVSVILSDAETELIRFLTNVSFDVTDAKVKKARKKTV